jgi:hypothetical protein
MSDTVINKGRLVPYIHIYNITTDTLDHLLDTGDYVQIDNLLYRYEFDIRDQKDLYFSDVKQDDKGVIHFTTVHYNGGCGLDECITDALK